MVGGDAGGRKDVFEDRQRPSGAQSLLGDGGPGQPTQLGFGRRMIERGVFGQSAAA